MIYKKFLKSLILLLSLFYTTFVYSSEKIFYIDLDYIMNNSLAGKSIIDNLDNINKKNFDEFRKSEDELKKEEVKIISQKNILNKDEYELKINSFKKKVVAYNQKNKIKINNIKKNKEKAQRFLTNSLTPILTSYAEENSISYILPKQNIIIGKGELDITKIILKKLDSKVKNVTIK